MTHLRRPLPSNSLLLVLILAALIAGAARAADVESVPGELLVRFKTGMSQTAIDSSNQAVRADGAIYSPGAPPLYLVRLPDGIDNASGQQLYNNLSNVERVEENFLYELLLTPNDPLFSQQYALQKISAPSAWDITVGSASVVIADTDTGMDYNHPDLAGNL